MRLTGAFKLVDPCAEVKRALWLVLCAFGSVSSFADEASSRAYLKEQIERALPHVTVHRVSRSEVPSLFEIELRERGAIIYATDDASYIIAGDLYAVHNDGAINLTESRRETWRQSVLERLDSADLITFAPVSASRAIVYAFTDVDCSYCRSMHRDMHSINQHGVEVRYLAYPRAGAISSVGSYDKMVTVWCSNDRREALSQAKLGLPLPSQSCENPVASHFDLGESLGVEGTPTLFSSSGHLIEGYDSVEKLIDELGLQ